jgi:hypothetical protein
MANINFTIDDPLEMSDRAGIEVTVTLPSGENRWCVFITPEALTRCGDIICGARVHLGERHIVTVSAISQEVIETVLNEIIASGELEHRTLPL